MTDASESAKYVIISPVKDEERYVEKTLRSVISQTCRPEIWVIVDDGSRDSTVSIIKQAQKDHPWIRVLKTHEVSARRPGSPVIRAFNLGYKAVKDEDFDFVVKLDCDLEFDAEYFSKILSRFFDDPELGIASGVYLEETDRSWKPVKLPDYHAAGACKVVRRACLEQIGGFIRERGWDTIDQIRARMRGCKTQHFKDLILYHLKKEGSGIGFIRTNVIHGEIYYLTGGGWFFFLAKVLHRTLRGKPPILAGFALLFGFLRLWSTGKPRLVTEEEADCYRRLLNQRMGTFAGFGRRRGI